MNSIRSRVGVCIGEFSDNFDLFLIIQQLKDTFCPSPRTHGLYRTKSDCTRRCCGIFINQSFIRSKVMRKFTYSVLLGTALAVSAPVTASAQVADLAQIVESACNTGSSGDCVAALRTLRASLGALPVPPAQVAAVQTALAAATANAVRSGNVATVRAMTAEVLSVANTSMPAAQRAAVAQQVTATVQASSLPADVIAEVTATAAAVSTGTQTGSVAVGGVAPAPVTETPTAEAPDAPTAASPN